MAFSTTACPNGIRPSLSNCSTFRVSQFGNPSMDCLSGVFFNTLLKPEGLLMYLFQAFAITGSLLLFLVAFIFVLLINLHFSVVISIFHEKNKVLAQEITLMKNALREAGIDTTGAPKKDEKGLTDG